MKMKSNGLVCYASFVMAMYATIKNVHWRLPSPISQHNRETATLEQKFDSQMPLKLPDTTIIITSNYIPTHPSTDIIDRTIKSLDFLEGLLPSNCSESSLPVPVIITVDGPYGKDRGPDSPRQQLLTKYIKNLEHKYGRNNGQRCSNLFNLTILPQKVNVKLIKNMHHALKYVTTEFIYVIQHDLPFVSSVNHTALVNNFQQYPDTVRLVRFGLHKTLSRHKDVPLDGSCEELFLSSDGVDLSKTLTWSDNNHFTRKTYYEEMFDTVPGFRDANFMEVPMMKIASTNCTKWGTWLYGKPGHGPMLEHLDGRHTVNLSKQQAIERWWTLQQQDSDAASSRDTH